MPENNGLIVLQMPNAVRDLAAAQRALAQRYAKTGLKFTLDGRLVGDIAEAIALEHFGLVLPERRTGGVDALTATGRTVQVKSTGKEGAGPAFTHGEGFADYLLFFQLNFAANTATVAYNGPEAPLRKLLPDRWAGTKSLSLSVVTRLAKTIDDALPRITQADAETD